MASTSQSHAGPDRGTALALARQAFRDARVRTIAFVYLFALYSYIQPAGYRHTYPTITERLSFARSFGPNKALRLFYGEPHDLLTVSGYTAWRVGGTLAIFAAVFGLLAAVRALRTEEDTGRMELVLAGVVGRRTTYLTAITAIAAGVLLLWLGGFTGFLIGGLPAGGAAYLALATVSVAPVFVGVGALSSQLAPTRRLALELGGAVLALMLLLRVIADTAGGAGWLRWMTPLGWAEQLRPFAGPQPLVLLLPAAASVLLLALSARIALRRDIGTGTLPARDSAAPRLGLLSSPTAQALRSERTSLLVWASGVGVFALILGAVSKSVSSADIPPGVQRELAKLGSGSIATPTGYLAFVFLAALAYAIVPRASAGIACGLLTVAFLWQLVAALLGVPQWLVDLTPFAHVGLVPTQPFRSGAAALMLAAAAGCALAAAAGCALAATWIFRRRDLTGQ